MENANGCNYDKIRKILEMNGYVRTTRSIRERIRRLKKDEVFAEHFFHNASNDDVELALRIADAQTTTEFMGGEGLLNDIAECWLDAQAVPGW